MSVAHPAPRRITTDRLILRAPQPGRDAPQAFTAVQHNRNRLARWLPWVPAIRTEAAELAFLEQVLVAWEDCAGFQWLIFERQTFQYLGIIGTAHLGWQQGLAELGYWLTADAEGRGYMNEAVEAVERTLFAMGMHRLEIRCSSDNERSAAIPARLGYSLDGRLREDRVEAGRRVDTLIWSKLRHEVVVPMATLG